MRLAGDAVRTLRQRLGGADYLTGLAVAGIFYRSAKTDGGVQGSLEGLVQKGHDAAGCAGRRAAMLLNIDGREYPSAIRRALESLNRRGNG